MKELFDIGDVVEIVDQDDFYFGRKGFIKSVSKEYDVTVYTVEQKTAGGGSITCAYRSEKLKGIKSE